MIGLQYAVLQFSDWLFVLCFKIDLEGMVRCGVSCLKPEYIASFLTDDPLPDPAQFYIPEVARFIRWPRIRVIRNILSTDCGNEISSVV